MKWLAAVFLLALCAGLASAPSTARADPILPGFSAASFSPGAPVDVSRTLRANR